MYQDDIIKFSNKSSLHDINKEDQRNKKMTRDKNYKQSRTREYYGRKEQLR